MRLRSGYEYQVRDALIAAHIDFEYETEIINYKSLVRGSKCEECGAKIYKQRKYNPDFIIHRADYTKLYIEAKGRLSSTDRSKMRDVQKQHPELDIRFLFQRRSKKQMEEVEVWCLKFNFDYHFGTEIPGSWLA